jgi:hypothetical protein
MHIGPEREHGFTDLELGLRVDGTANGELVVA